MTTKQGGFYCEETTGNTNVSSDQDHSFRLLFQNNAPTLAVATVTTAVAKPTGLKSQRVLCSGLTRLLVEV